MHGLDELTVRWQHTGRAAALVRQLKYGRRTAVTSRLAGELAAIAPPADLVTWVPCTPARRRQRGFDPAELLARAVARRLHLPARSLLRRLDREPQTSRTREGRLEGPTLAAHRRRRVNGRVLVVDDVCTTGSTLRVAATELRRLGAKSVVATVVTAAPAPFGAETPSPRHRTMRPTTEDRIRR